MKVRKLKSLAEIPVMGALDDSPRGRVLRAAAHLFHVQGYERTTVRDLARLVGIQSGSLFHHFSSKEEILVSVMEEAIRYNFSRIQENLQQAQSPFARLEVLIRGELESILGPTGEAMSVLVYEWDALSADCQQRVLTLREVYEASWLQTLESLGQLHAVPYPAFFWRRLLAGAIAWTSHWYRPEGSLTLDGLTGMVMAMAIPKQSEYLN